jgi:hypothetical protein
MGNITLRLELGPCSCNARSNGKEHSGAHEERRLTDGTRSQNTFYLECFLEKKNIKKST